MFIKTSEQEKVVMGFGNYTCNWGLHIAGLYETEEERDEIIFGYLHEGFKDNDILLYVPTERTPEDFKKDYSNHCPHCKEQLATSNNLSIYSGKELYYPDGYFSPKAMDEGLNSFYSESQKNGKRNVRATAEMVWALDAIPGIEGLMAYEARLNYFIPGKPWISICLYNVNKFDGAMIMNVLRTHPYTISKGIITQNPYFQDPKEWLKQNAPQFLEI